MNSPALKTHDLAPSHQRARGTGELVVATIDGTTSIQRLYQKGCAKIRVPRSTSKYLEAVMINTSGGMTGGDELDWKFSAHENTTLTVTTQACERVYKSSIGSAHANISLRARRGATLHWLPQETILFDQCGLKRKINVELDTDSELLMVEPLVFGRKAMGEINVQGSVYDSWRIHQSGNLIHAEDFRMSGNLTDTLASPFVADSKTACATILLVSSRVEGLINEAKEIVGGTGGVSCWNGKLLARIISHDSYKLRQTMCPLLALLNGEKSMPKIWAN